jgi:hypothetical protein
MMARKRQANLRSCVVDCGNQGSIVLKAQGSMVRLTLLVLPFLLFLAGIGWAQPSSPVQASPVAMASTAAAPSGNMIGQPQMAGPCPYPP